MFITGTTAIFMSYMSQIASLTCHCLTGGAFKLSVNCANTVQEPVQVIPMEDWSNALPLLASTSPDHDAMHQFAAMQLN